MGNRNSTIKWRITEDDLYLKRKTYRAKVGKYSVWVGYDPYIKSRHKKWKEYGIEVLNEKKEIVASSSADDLQSAKSIGITLARALSERK